MNAADLLAELGRQGIAVAATPDRHLRLTGSSEAALTPELRAAVEAARAALLVLLAASADGVSGATTASRSTDPSGVPDGFGWAVGGATVVVLIGAAYVFWRTSQAPARPTPPSALLPRGGWPYIGWADGSTGQP